MRYKVFEQDSSEDRFRAELESLLNLGWELVSLKFYRASGCPYGFAVLRRRQQ